jgi:hypothetical protein
MVQYYTSYKVTACFMFTSKRFFIIATLNWLQGLKKVIMQETMLCMTRQNTVKRNPLQLVQRCSWIKTIKIMPEIINNKQSFWDLYASTFCFLFLFLPVTDLIPLSCKFTFWHLLCDNRLFKYFSFRVTTT